MLIKRYAVIGLVLSLCANTTFAGGVRVFKFEETPDPQEVASVLSRSSPPPGLKMRSIRIIPAAPDSKPAEAMPTSSRHFAETPSSAYVADREDERPQLAEHPNVAERPQSSERPQLAFTGAASPTATDEPHVAAPIRPAAPQQKADDLPASFALPVQFAFDSAAILPSAYRQLDAVAKGIRLARPGVKVVIEGHTDAQGSAEYNLKLSAQRAEAVRTYLITRHGIDPAQLRVVGMGKFAPLNKFSPGAPENRRVEFRAEA